MNEVTNYPAGLTKFIPWNKGKVIGAKPPLRPKHVWSIRTKLQVDRRLRDLAMFNVAIDSKLRGCDVVALKINDVAPGGYAVDRATVRQSSSTPLRPTGATMPNSARWARIAAIALANKIARMAWAMMANVDHRSLLADKQMPRTVEHETGLLVRCLDWYKPHVRPLHRLTNGLGIGGIVLLAFQTGFT